MQLTQVSCCICGTNDADPVGLGPDYEYRTSPDVFLAFRCRRDGLVYLDPRPDMSELGRIYPDDYHAFSFSPERFGFVYRVRRRLEARRALRWARGLGPGARIVDVGCGDGFHLELLRDFGPGWHLEGIEPDERAADAARSRGLLVHQAFLEEFHPEQRFDLVILNHTIEHVDDPARILLEVRRVLRPGGRVVVTTDNSDSLDFKMFKGGHWGGYHFPRHWNLFNRRSMEAVAQKVGLRVVGITTVVSPVNWTYSFRNLLDDLGASRRVVGWFSLESAFVLGVFTIFDSLHTLFGRGALIRATLEEPEDPRS